MATKPASLPEWNSGGTNNVEPSGGKKVLGWVTDEVPPSATLNWWMAKVYNWLQWVDNGFIPDLVATALTWTAAQAFSAGVTLTRSSDTSPLLSGASTSPTLYRYLAFLGGSSSNTLRLYLGFDGSLLVSRNALFVSPGSWTRDAAANSHLYTFGPNGFLVRQYLAASASPWVDGAWVAGASVIGGAGSLSTLAVSGASTLSGALTVSGTSTLGATSTGALSPTSIVEEAKIAATILAPWTGFINCWKSKSGIVYVEGYVSGVASGTGSMFVQLPAGYEPSRQTAFSATKGSTPGVVRFETDGRASNPTGTASTVDLLDVNVEFRP